MLKAPGRSAQPPTLKRLTFSSALLRGQSMPVEMCEYGRVKRATTVLKWLVRASTSSFECFRDLDAARPKDDDEQHGQEEQNHRHRQLRRQRRRLLLSLAHAHVAVLLRHDSQTLAERRSVAFRLLQGQTDRLHAFETGALRQIFVSNVAVLQIG